MIFFTSDNHFGHANIIKFCNRPFSSVEEMDETMVQNWNKKVKPEDTVYHLGDFVWKDNSIIKKLNGEIIITTGDHDESLKKNLVEYHHQEVLKIDYGKQSITGIDVPPIYCLHWCMRTWPKSHYNSWHLYGHSHGRLPPIGKSWDVGVDNNNFEPISINEVVLIMNGRPDNPNLVKGRK